MASLKGMAWFGAHHRRGRSNKIRVEQTPAERARQIELVRKAGCEGCGAPSKSICVCDAEWDRFAGVVNRAEDAGSIKWKTGRA